MSPEGADPAERPLTPAEEEQVRRALSSWRPGPDAMPADVAARLAATIDELAAERRPAPAGLRARRRWPNVLVAAAAVSMVALGVGNLVQGDGGGDAMSASDAGASAESAEPPESADKAAQPAGPEASSYAAAPLPRLHSDTLRRDVARLAGVTPSTATNRRQETRDLSGAATRCALPTHARTERLLLARLDGRLVSVVLDRAHSGSREARVYSCGDPAAPLASFSVPVG